MLPRRLRAARRRAKLSAIGASRKAGLAGGHVAMIEAGRVRMPRAETLLKIATALDVSVAYLLGGPREDRCHAPEEG